MVSDNAPKKFFFDPVELHFFRSLGVRIFSELQPSNPSAIFIIHTSGYVELDRIIKIHSAGSTLSAVFDFLFNCRQSVGTNLFD